MTQCLNIAAYKFVQLKDIPAMQEQYKMVLAQMELKGTIIFAPEGVNLMLAGTEDNIKAFKEYFAKEQEFSDMIYKDTWSDRNPFHRTLVKHKQEIIPLGHPEIEPEKFTGEHISPEELKQWYDEDKDFTMLDTRNDYEVRMGTFEKAVDPNLKAFRDFPEYVDQLDEALKEKPLVMFCTGGVRCEKASVYMLNRGFKKVYQLDGGILNYFAKCGGDHYNGECFVFDHRVGVDSDLKETDTEQCYRCQEPLTLEQQQSPEYVLGEHCPYCINKKDKQIEG